jgi:hypothetical protein
LFVSVLKSTQAPLQRLKPLSHTKVHALETQAGLALATADVQALPHALQFETSVVVSTQALPHGVGIAGGHPDTQVDFEHTGVPPLHARPQPPQLFLSLVVSTHPPAHGVKPELQVNEHELAMHAGCAFATPVVQVLPHVLQFARSLVASTHVPPQRSGAAAGHPDTHE